MGAEDIFSKVKPRVDKLKKGPLGIKRKPRKVGVMNPFVLYQMVKPDFIGNPDTIDLNDEAVLAVLNDHFKKTGQIQKPLSFSQLFNPKISPLYKRPKFKPISLIRKAGHGEESPDVSGDARENKSLTGAVYIKPRDPTKKSQIFNDVIQGAAVNCYFHAALHSTVWASWGKDNTADFPPAMNAIQFSGQTVNVTASFLLGPNGKPVGAQPSIPDNEYWACAWEKAYAEFKKLPKNTKANAAGTWPTPPYDPNILAFSQSDPLLSLQEITNNPWDFTSDTFGYPTAFDNWHTWGSCYDILNSDNCGNISGNSMITANPTVAWTKETDATYGPPGAIISNHAYSILGTFRYGTPLANYIVFRNPWNKPFSTANYPNICQGGTYNPGLDTGIVLGPSSTKGIFALKDSAFKTYFLGFGWTQEIP